MRSKRREGSAREVSVVVFREEGAAVSRGARTRRALESLGLAPIELSRPGLSELRSAPSGPLWLVRAGAWPVRVSNRQGELFPPPALSGAPLCGLGALASPPESTNAPSAESTTWSRLLQKSGGDLNRAFRRSSSADLPPLPSVYLNASAAHSVSAHCAHGLALAEALMLTLQRGLRVVRYAPLDVHDDARPRVAQVVTSLQRGGAERVAIDLTEELPHQGISSCIYSIYSPTRGAFALPAAGVDLTRVVPAAASREQRFAHLGRELVAWGADLVHAHLLDAADLARLSENGFRALVTVHNTRGGFPQGLTELSSEHAALLVGCASAIESELRAAQVPIPVRTAWNGIRAGARGGKGGWRERLGIAPESLVLLALANPRPQKRLHVLPAIAAAVRAADARRRAVHLIFAGSAAANSETAQRALSELQREIGLHGFDEHAHFVGLVTDPASLLAESDVLVSPSEHEGLSLAHLEALAASVPVVASGVGGTRELAADCPRLRHLPVASDAATFARAILEVELAPVGSSSEVVERHYSAPRMAAEYARLYPPTITRNTPSKRRAGVLLVTNNFSLGGAQSSARRLLLGLRAAGTPVRAVTLEEQPEYPTLGRAALRQAGIDVLALPPPRDLDPAGAVALLLRSIVDDPPETVLLWNVIVEHKLLLADGLLDTPLFDVSPGEMYFTSLRRYFATSRRPGLPYRDERDYGARLSGVIVKYAGESTLAAQTLGCPVHVIPNGVDTSRSPRPKPRTASRLSIGTAVRIHPDKRLDDLLSAVRLAAPSLPPFVLRIAGGVDRGADTYAEELRRATSDLPVEWLGELADPREFLDDLDLFALIAEPAGCPNASLEAMARGLPVVATDVGGMREQIEPGVTGKLVPRGDTPAFAAALVALGRDASLRRQLGEAAFERAQRCFALERMVAAYREVCLTPAPSPDRPLSTAESASDAFNDAAHVIERLVHVE